MLLENRNLIARIDNLLEQKQIKVDYKEETDSRLPNVLAEYDSASNCVIFYKEEIHKSFFEKGYNVFGSEEDFYIIILCHELGHKFDDSLQDSMKKRESLVKELLPYNEIELPDDLVEVAYELVDEIVDNEIKANENGRQFVGDNLILFYNKFCDDNINSSKDLIFQYLDRKK